ncbi:hypothetical protein HZA97_03995 [Candidatus Woesearchaeota archaeon]|nr:hypothetical protein [Candidatus Woesearchaeota archaeon]
MAFIKKEDLEKQIKEEQKRLREIYSQAETIDPKKVEKILAKGKTVTEQVKLDADNPFDPYFLNGQYCKPKNMQGLNETERVYVHLCVSMWDNIGTADFAEYIKGIYAHNPYPEFQDLSKIKMEDLIRFTLTEVKSKHVLERIFLEHRHLKEGDVYKYALQNYPLFYTWMTTKELNEAGVLEEIEPHCREIRERLKSGEILDINEFGRVNITLDEDDRIDTDEFRMIDPEQEYAREYAPFDDDNDIW